MAIRSNVQATLTQGQFKTLFTARFRKCRVTLTGLSGEGTTIRFRIEPFAGAKTVVDTDHVQLSLFQTIPLARVSASPPEGVGTLDIVYEVRTGADA
jgi:hypothetical protein